MAHVIHMADKLKQFQMRVDDEFLKALDDLRKLAPDLPSRAEVIRRAIQKMLSEAKGKKR